MIHFLRQINSGFARKIMRYFIEILVIFIGVMMAFIADNWREKSQDRNNYRTIMEEIENNVRLDSIEMLSDKADVMGQIACVDRIINDSLWNLSITEGNKIAPCIKYILFVDWPDYVLTGYNQLLSSKIVPSDYDEELMFRIYEYHQWIDFHYLRTSQTVNETYDLQKYFISQEYYPGQNINNYEDDLAIVEKIRSDPKFMTQLKFLKANRLEELRIYNAMQEKANNILSLFMNLN